MLHSFEIILILIDHYWKSGCSFLVRDKTLNNDKLKGKGHQKMLFEHFTLEVLEMLYYFLRLL